MRQSLYTRLGGYDVIAAFVVNWLALVVLDPQLSGYFTGMTIDARRRARQLIVDFIAERAGGPVIYTGRSMNVRHEALGISAGDYALLMRHAVTAPDGLRVVPDARVGLVAFLETLEAETAESP